jgi:sec-independent protein translocase protein TatA
MFPALIPVLPTVGPTELIIVLAIILLLFGAKRIPELARGLGTGIREFKRGTRGEVDEEKKDEELTAGAGEDSARMQEEEAARAERTEQKR